MYVRTELHAAKVLGEPTNELDNIRQTIEHPTQQIRGARMRMNIPRDQKSSQLNHIPELKPSLEVTSLDLLMMMETIEPADDDFSAPPTAAPQSRPKRGHA